METSNIHSLPKRATRRPTLFDGDSRAPAEDFAHSMLAPLERDPRKHPAALSGKRSGGRYFAAAFVLLSAALAAVVIGMDPPPDRLASTPPAAVATDGGLAVPPVATKPVESAPVLASSTAMRARIEPAVETPPAPAPPPTTAPAQAIPASPVVATAATVGVARAEAAPAAPAAHRTVSRDPPPRLASSGTTPNAAPATAPASDARQAAVARPKPAAPVARAGTQQPRSAKGKEDPDIDLVAAIIARLDRRGSEPPGPGRNPSSPAGAAAAGTAARLQQCSARRDPVEARQCRSKACDGHWGRIDACPASRAPKTSYRGGVRDVAHG